MTDYSNIEIINFESINNDEIIADCLYENDDITYFIDKYNIDYLNSDIHNESDSLTLTEKDSDSSYNSEMSCYTESFQLCSQSNLSKESEKSQYLPDNGNVNFSKLAKKERLFSCTECSKIYKSKENMTLHFKNIHLKQKPYNCKYCTSVFSHRNGNCLFILGKTYHERKFHTKYLPHKCEYEDCYAMFASKSALNYHMKSQHKSGKKFCKSKFN
jgi:hypothetical protein